LLKLSNQFGAKNYTCPAGKMAPRRSHGQAGRAVRPRVPSTWAADEGRHGYCKSSDLWIVDPCGRLRSNAHDGYGVMPRLR